MKVIFGHGGKTGIFGGKYRRRDILNTINTIKMGFSFLTQELAMDLGTANTVIFQNDEIVLDEPSIIAIDNNTVKPISL